jgi:hypothetical protein
MSRGLLPPKVGKHNLICDISGEKIRSDKYRKTWDGLVVSPDDYDPKHPQLNLRPRKEKISVRPTRDRPVDVFVTSVDPNSLNGRE